MKNFFELFNLRFEFETLTRRFEMPKGSSIDIIEWFVENGHRSNRLRDGFEDALKIAKQIQEYANAEKAARRLEVQ